MNTLVNFSGKNFEKSRRRLNDSAKRFDMEKVLSFDEAYIEATAFYQQHENIFKYQKGFGLWIWKPYLVLEALEQSADGDIVIYSDSGIELLSYIDPLIDLCQEKDIILFANGNLKNKFWTKRDCFVLMDCDEDKYWNGVQVDAAFCLFKKKPFTITFVKEWLSYCIDIRLISDEKNVMGKENFFGFHRHRHDQSVLSLLAIKHSLELFRQPTQFGNHYKIKDCRIPGEFNCISQFRTKQVAYYSAEPLTNSRYFQLLNHHRERTDEIQKERLNVVQLIFKSGTRRLKKIIKLLTRQ